MASCSLEKGGCLRWPPALFLFSLRYGMVMGIFPVLRISVPFFFFGGNILELAGGNHILFFFALVDFFLEGTRWLFFFFRFLMPLVLASIILQALTLT